ncbi:ubiquitin-like-specific protease ESD4 [Bidens hawaiensis]|uniref:ubiquitin-like-specific protease ESD4 n=1 Tax=Bidens hawaiensis TaxID=980011 RepID=UPI00404B2131
MCALTCNRYKRHVDSQFHSSKKLKPSDSASMVSRLSLYPQQLTPIAREIQAPCIVVTGFTSTAVKRSGSDTMEDLLSNYNRTKEVAKGTCRFVNFETLDEVVELTDDDHNNDINIGDDNINIINENENNINENDVSGDSVVEEIRAKYRELDHGKVEEEEDLNLGMVSELMEGKGLELLSLDPRPDVSVDAGWPCHKKLLDSVQKIDLRLNRLSFDIKLQEEKRALFKQLTFSKKDEPKKDDEDKLLEPFRPLTEDDKDMVTIALSNASRRKVLVTHDNSNITITGEVLQCLRPGAWLNDEVINVYLELLKEREKKEPKKFLKCHFHNTFFYKKLISGKTGYDYKSVRRWTTQKKLGYSLHDCDNIFIPVHKEIHWCLAVINKKEEKFQYLDSLGGTDKQVMTVLAKYFVDEVKDKNGEDIDVTCWQQEYVTDLPNQENGFDCGVFMIKYADFYSRDIGLCFKQEHMPYFRSRTAMEILNLRAD